MKHFVNLSGGAGSWYTGRRVVGELAAPGDEAELVFADTLMEDEDLYRFLAQCVADLGLLGEERGVGVRYTRLADGRDPWQVFFDERYLGNTRVDPCSKILKRQLIRRHLEASYGPDEVTCYIGIDWSESHRLERAVGHWAPYEVRAPLCDPPYVDREDVLAAMRGLGIEPPRLYAMGFPHNNCGGFCVKGGQGAFKLLLERMPERYAYHEEQERRFRAEVPGRSNVAILRDRTGGRTRPLTLQELRERVEAGREVDDLDMGGCACFTPDEPDTVALGMPAPRPAAGP